MKIGALESKSFAQLSISRGSATEFALIGSGTEFALISSTLHVQDLDSRQLLFARLRKIGIQLPLAAAWRSFGDRFLAISNIGKHLTLTKYLFQFRCFITCSL